MFGVSVNLGDYTFRFGELGQSTPVTVEIPDGGVARSLELDFGSAEGFSLAYDGNDVKLEIPEVTYTGDHPYKKFSLTFVVGYTLPEDESTEYPDEYDELDVRYEKVGVDMYAVLYEGKPDIDYIENLATKVSESELVTVHGHNMTDGLSIKIFNGESEYVVPPEDIEFDIGDDGYGTAEFTVYPRMLAENADGTEPCAVYDVYFGYGKNNYNVGDANLIRYKYDSSTEEMQKYSTENFTREKKCYETGTMSLVYDTVDEHGNPVSNPQADPRLGKDIVVRIGADDNCEDYFYTMVRVKYNKNLTHKAGELKLNGIQLYDGDLVWLSNQLVEEEEGIWVVRTGNWEGYDPYLYSGANNDISEPVCPANCVDIPEPYKVGKNVLVDLGAKATYPVDYVCKDDVPYKCGSRTICGYNVEPGAVVALLNQKDGNGIYVVRCGEWERIGDVDEDSLKGTTVDMSHSIITQNDIDFCRCGGVFHIDYFLLTPSCYLHHLQRTVKIQCAGASIVPNAVDSQVKITEYVITVGEEDSLVGNRGRVPGDPVKEDCAVVNEDFEVDFGLHLVEFRQYVKNPPCLTSPACSPVCDIPRFYNLRMTDDYTNSNDRNGFTIKFWRHESDGWHLYAYIGSGTRTYGVDYYVYHLHVAGKASETQVDVNEHDWFTVNDDSKGVLALGDGADCFGLCDDTWEFQYKDADGNIVRTHNLDSSTLYMPWRIRCTTTLLAHCNYDDHKPRTTCKDMEDMAKQIAASGDMCYRCSGTGEIGGDPCPVCEGTGRYPEGYMHGMPHLFGVAYYTEVMSKSQFVAEYNKYNPDCIGFVKKPDEVLVTDQTDSTGVSSAIATDNTSGDAYEAITPASTASYVEDRVYGGTSGSAIYTFKRISELDVKSGTGEDETRDWLPVTSAEVDGERITVRVPYPMGDFDKNYDEIDGTAVHKDICTICNGVGVVNGEQCPVCEGTGFGGERGAVTVNENGVISLRIDDATLGVTVDGKLYARDQVHAKDGGGIGEDDTGIFVKVDEDTIKIGEDGFLYADINTLPLEIIANGTDVMGGTDSISLGNIFDYGANVVHMHFDLDLVSAGYASAVSYTRFSIVVNDGETELYRSAPFLWDQTAPYSMLNLDAIVQAAPEAELSVSLVAVNGDTFPAFTDGDGSNRVVWSISAVPSRLN